MGDELLVEVAQRLKYNIRDEDTISRLGGDEFVILLTDLSPELNKATTQASHVAEKTLLHLARPITTNDHELQITTSIGIAIYPTDADNMMGLVKRADNALYKAKDLGRNNFQFFTPYMQIESNERMSLQHALRSGLVDEAFELYYQPQINIKTNTICSAEVLLRWHHPTKGLVPPQKFIPITEDTGMIIAIGTWVLEQTCKQIASWNKSGVINKAQFIAVNISNRQFQQKNFIAEIDRILTSYNINPNQLELEFTESILIEHIEKNLSKLNTLRKMGVHLAIDDFGTGYSSLEYLKRFPVQVLKIDQSFICDISTNSNDASIVKSIVSLAKNLNLSVVAEGVENEQQLEFLKQIECDSYQGYYFSQAVTANECAELFSR